MGTGEGTNGSLSDPWRKNNGLNMMEIIGFGIGMEPVCEMMINITIDNNPIVYDK
jgi:hypothetical protein